MKEVIGYNWAKYEAPDKSVRALPKNVDIDDETLRDGLQGTQVETHPTLEEKKIYIKAASEFADHFDLGFPGSENNHQGEIEKLINYKLSRGLDVSLSCAARGAAKVDVVPIVRLRQKTGYPLEADLFHDVSEERALIQKWNRSDKIVQLVENIKYLKENDVPVMMVLERATSTEPAELFEISRIASDLGIDRLCIADTQGRASPQAISNIIRATQYEIASKYPNIKWDLHSHNDRGLGVVTCLVAASEGIDRVHATSLCVGERAGNVDLACLLVNLNLEGFRSDNLEGINEFSSLTSELLHVQIPTNAPVIGEEAFSTASGVHADAQYKEESHAEGYVGIYFAYDPVEVGRRPNVRIGPFSGESNVRYSLDDLGIDNPSDEMVKAILAEAKSGRGLLSKTKILGIATQYLNGVKEPSS